MSAASSFAVPDTNRRTGERLSYVRPFTPAKKNDVKGVENHARNEHHPLASRGEAIKGQRIAL